MAENDFTSQVIAGNKPPLTAIGEFRNAVWRIVTYAADEGTCGYLLSEGQVDEITDEAHEYAKGLVAAERERIYAELGNDHFVIFTDHDWTLEHSVECRLSGNMATSCPYRLALMNSSFTDEPNPNLVGRWRIEIDERGRIVLPDYQQESEDT